MTCYEWHGYTTFGHEVPLRGTERIVIPAKRGLLASSPNSRAIYGMGGA